MIKNLSLAGLTTALILSVGPALAASKKEKECGYQADIVTAIQKARLERVRERKVTEVVLAGEVTWPERYNDTIAIFASEIYKLKKKDLRTRDAGAEWRETCLANYK